MVFVRRRNLCRKTARSIRIFCGVVQRRHPRVLSEEWKRSEDVFVLSPEVVRVFHGSCFQASWKFCELGVFFDELSNLQVREQRFFDRVETVCVDIYALRVNLRFLFEPVVCA